MKQVLLYCIFALGLMFFAIKYEEQDKVDKELLILNVDSTTIINPNQFTLKGIEGYWTEMSITFSSDSSYTIVLWGDRKSIWWNIIRDKVITVSVPYNRSKGIDVETDVRLISAFDNRR